MAETTPPNLAGAFGGFVLGRAAGNKSVDQAVDRLEQQITKLADALQRFTSSMDAQAKAAGGPRAGGATSQSSASMGVGGNYAFSGTHAPTSHRADVVEPRWTGGGYAGRHAAGGHAAGATGAGGGGFGNGGTVTFGGAPGGAHSGGPPAHSAGAIGAARTMYAQAGGRVGIGKRVGQAAGVGLGIYTLNHYDNQTLGQTIASQYGAGMSDSAANRAVMFGNYTAASDQDHLATQQLLGSRAGFGLMGQGFKEARTTAAAMSYADPSLTNAQNAQTMMALGAPSTFNMMRGLGIRTMGRNGQVNPMSVARQILQRTGASNIRTARQMNAAFGPAGSIETTLQGLVRSGYLPAEALQGVRSSAEVILKGQISGAGYGEVNRLLRTASGSASTTEAGDAARDRLREMDIGKSLVQTARDKAGLARDSEAATIDGFTKGVKGATAVLAEFRDGMNKLLNTGVFGDLIGIASGGLGSLPAVGGIARRFGMPNLGAPMGGGPMSMSSGHTMYAGSVGVAVGAGFGGGSTGVMGSGPESMGSSRAQYAGRTNSAGGGGGGGGGGTSRGSAARTTYPGLSGVKSWVAAAGAHLASKFGIRSVGGIGSRGYASDHSSGLAVDFMCSKAQGDRLAAYAQANAGKLNITYIIWYKRIWSVQRKGEGWRPYNSTPDGGTSPTQLHMDHVHISFLSSPNNSDFSDLRGASGAGFPSGGGGGGAGLGEAAAGNANAGSGGGAASSYGFAGFSEVASLGLGGSPGGGVFGGGGGAASAGDVGGAAGGAGTSGAGSMGATTGGAGDVRTGTYNLLHSTSNAQSKRDLLKLMGKTDVLSLTEWTGKKKGLAEWIRKQGWGVSQGPGDTANIYDLSDYERVRGGSRRLNDPTGSRGGLRARYAQYDLLRDKDSGMEFWQVGAHLAPLGSARNNPAGLRAQRQQWDALENLKKELGDNVVIAGDFNIRRPGMGGVRSSSGQINSVLYGGGASLNSRSLIGGLSSDHNAALASLTFGGGGGGGHARGLEGGGPAANMRLARAMLKNMGWGNQWNALKNLWMRESGFRTNADNPTSSAYGIPQAMTSVHNMPPGYMTDPRVQIQWGLNYIKNRYGNPANAWAHFTRNNSYAVGEWNIRADQDARVHKGEMILPSKVAEIVRNELTAPTRGGRGSGGPQIVFQKDAIQVNLGGNPSKKDAEKVGTWVVDAIAEDNRMKALMRG